MITYSSSINNISILALFRTILISTLCFVSLLSLFFGQSHFSHFFATTTHLAASLFIQCLLFYFVVNPFLERHSFFLSTVYSLGLSTEYTGQYLLFLYILSFLLISHVTHMILSSLILCASI